MCCAFGFGRTINNECTALVLDDVFMFDRHYETEMMGMDPSK